MALKKSSIKKRSIVLGEHKTSISLEDPFWDVLKHIARTRDIPLALLISQIDRRRGAANLSSAIRVFALEEQIRMSEERQ